MNQKRLDSDGTITNRQRPLGEIAHIFIGPPTPPRTQREEDFRYVRTVLRPEGPIAVKVIGMRAIAIGTIDEGAFETFYVSNDNSITEYLVHPGDLLIQARSTTLNMAIVPDYIKDTIINNHVIVIRSQALTPRLLMAYLGGSVGRAALTAISQSTTLQMNLTIKQISQLEVPVPPSAIQSQLNALLESAATQYESALEAAERRRSVAQQIAVDVLIKGELPHGT